jgi:predicted amidophosphoribosyltransferase
LWFGNTITYRAFRQWKLTGASRLARILFQAHPSLLRELESQRFDAVVPIPQDLRRSWARGFESARVTAQFFSEILQIPVYRALDYQAPPGGQQAMKDRIDRTLGENPFRVHPRIELPARMLIVDDVVTTGATLVHAIATLENAIGSFGKISAAALVYKPPSQQKTKNLNYSSLARSVLADPGFR